MEVRRGTDHWIGGVASGVAERFDLSPILVRGIFVALSFLAGLGLLVYGLAWALLPGPDGRIEAQQAAAGRWSTSMTWALLFFIGGAIGFPWFFSWWDGGFWTFLVIAAIIFVIFSRRGRYAEGSRPANGAPQGGPTGHYTDPSSHPASDPWTTQFTEASQEAASRESGEPGSPSTTSTNIVTDVVNVESGTQGPMPNGAPDSSWDTPTTSFGPLTQEQTMSLASQDPSKPATVNATLPQDTPLPTGGETSAAESQPSNDWSANWAGNWDKGTAKGHTAGSGFTPPPFTPPASTRAPKAPRNRAMPGYVATIVLGFAVLVFALIVGLHQLGMLELPASPVAIGFAAALVVIALGIIGASLNQRTGGALTGFGIVALVFSLIWSGGALRAADINLFSNGITSVDENGSTNVFHSGEMDLRHYSTITKDTTVSVDNVFSSVKLIVPDNIPVELEFSGAFTSLNINGSSASSGSSSTLLNPGATGPTLHIELDGAFNSVEVSAQKAEVAP